MYKVSFTGVVGYQTTKSSTIVRVSPLFNIRSRRAINEESKDLNCDYSGKGEETNIHISSRAKRTEQVQKAVNIISKMDDKAFSKFVARIIPYLKNKEQMTDKEKSDLLQALHYIRTNLNDMEYYDTKNSPTSIMKCAYTLEYNIFNVFPFFIILMLIMLYNFIFGILLAILGWITSQTCMGYTFGACCPD